MLACVTKVKKIAVVRPALSGEVQRDQREKQLGPDPEFHEVQEPEVIRFGPDRGGERGDAEERVDREARRQEGPVHDSWRHLR